MSSLPINHVSDAVPVRLKSAPPRRHRLIVAGAIGLAGLLSGCASTKQAPLPTVPAVDLARYAGVWYEIARTPNWFEAKCAGGVQAHYTLDGDRVRVRNRCLTCDGKVTEARGVARAVPGSGNAKLRVSFFWPFYGDYWILALDPDYQWALVGEPSQRYAWILARTPALDAAVLEETLARAAALGFDREAFLFTRQP
ncbi:MAG: lipocalin family protein [Lentisphaerae bacterium]|nr:lipocalin family protein [Lentisphaerota bacterium]